MYHGMLDRKYSKIKYASWSVSGLLKGKMSNQLRQLLSREELILNRKLDIGRLVVTRRLNRIQKIQKMPTFSPKTKKGEWNVISLFEQFTEDLCIKAAFPSVVKTFLLSLCMQKFGYRPMQSIAVTFEIRKLMKINSFWEINKGVQASSKTSYASKKESFWLLGHSLQNNSE